MILVDAVDAEAGTLSILKQGCDVDVRGNQPSHCTALDQFPPDHFKPNKTQVNNIHCLNKTESNLHWCADYGRSVLAKRLRPKVSATRVIPITERWSVKGKPTAFWD